MEDDDKFEQLVQDLCPVGDNAWGFTNTEDTYGSGGNSETDAGSSGTSSWDADLPA